MIEPTTLARPYARAAFQFAVDNTAVDVWYEALQVLTSVVAEPNVACILDDPASTAAQRAETVSAVLGNDAPVGLAQFVAVLSENHRLS